MNRPGSDPGISRRRGPGNRQRGCSHLLDLWILVFVCCLLLPRAEPEAHSGNMFCVTCHFVHVGKINTPNLFLSFVRVYHAVLQ